MPYLPPSRSTSRSRSASRSSDPSDMNDETKINMSRSGTLGQNLTLTPSFGLNSDSNTLYSTKPESAINSSASLNTYNHRQEAFHKFMNHQNSSFNNQANANHNQSSSKFYLLGNHSSSFDSMDENANRTDVQASLAAASAAAKRRIPSRSNSNNSIFNSNSNSNSDSAISPPQSKAHQQFLNKLNGNASSNLNPNNSGVSSNDDLIKFTTESTQSYSYAPVSNNSLSMRLNVLKRSLEILLQTPGWLNQSLESFPSFDKIPEPISNNSSNNTTPVKQKSDPLKLKDYLKFDRTVSNSTLQTLIKSAISTEKANQTAQQQKLPLSQPFDEEGDTLDTYSVEDDVQLRSLSSMPPPPRPLFPRSTSELMTNSSSYSSCNSSLRSRSGSVPSVTVNDEVLDDLKEMLKLLKLYQSNDNELSKDLEDKAINLHNLSLANASENSTRKDLLKIKLLHALATPFIEQNSSRTLAGMPILNSTPSAIGLSTLAPSSQMPNNVINNESFNSNAKSKQFHASSNAKTKSPKAVFTVSTEEPWDLLNANDLGLLMFGFSKNSLRQMTLMDLIAPRSKQIVLDRLNRKTPLVFSGEIIAVKRDKHGLAWTSLWAKRRDNLIILIFEQVACETVDVIIQREARCNDYTIKEVIKQNKSLYAEDLRVVNVSEFLPSLSATLKNSSLGLYDDTAITSKQDSNIINQIRYFTIKREDNLFVPCAITSEYVEFDENDEKFKDITSLVRINLHSLPYIAGTIVINANNYQIQSFNEAIVKNLFGTGDLKNQSIDTILPEFTTLMGLTLEENPNIQHQEGIVLPEHYFRKLSCWLEGADDDERESLFLKCKGIKGRHNDGNTLIVDIQLHVSKNNLYVIWITFCRSVFKNQATQQEKVQSVTDLKEANKIEFKNMDSSHESFHLNDDTVDSIPSQLKLLDIHHSNINNYQAHLDSDSQGSMSTNVSRSNSLRTIDNTQSNISSPESPKVERLKSLTKITAETNGKGTSDGETNEKDIPKESIVTEDFGMSTPMSCEEQLLKENEEIKYLQTHSTYFPKVIGAEKRTKKFEDFTVIKELGQGAYGKVVFAQYKDDLLYQDCVKAIFKERILVDTWVRDRKLGTVPSEIQILYALNKFPHANITRIIDYFEDNNFYYLETMQHGSHKLGGAVDLYDIIEVKTDMTEYEAKYIYFQVASALTHMHLHGIVHRDIKDENIIVDIDYFVKLIDFGSAAWVKDGPFGVFVGTIDYAAPEVLNGQPYEGKAQDVWAMGVLLYTLVFKENPFCSVDEILDGEVKFPQYSNVSSECLQLIQKMLVMNVNKRPTMAEVLQDPWLAGFS